MGVFIRQNDNRSQLQEKLANELREKAKLQAGGEPLDQANNSRYVQDTETATKASGVWAAVIAVIVIAAVIFVVTR